MCLSHFLVVQVKLNCPYNWIVPCIFLVYFFFLVLLLSVIECWLQLCTLTLGTSVSLSAPLNKHSQFNLLASKHRIAIRSSCSTVLYSIGPSTVVLICLIPAVQWCSTIGYVPETEKSTYGSVNVAYKASSCALCVVFAHRLVPGQMSREQPQESASGRKGIICFCSE